MKFILFISIINNIFADLDHSFSGDHSISDGHSIDHNNIISHYDTGFNIKYIGTSSLIKYKLFQNFENEVEKDFVLDKINYNYTIDVYLNNINVNDDNNNYLNCLYYSKIYNNFNYTILDFSNISFTIPFKVINSKWTYCSKEFNENKEYNLNTILNIPILIITIITLIIVIIIISISCGIVRYRSIAHVHTFTTNVPNHNSGISTQELHHIHT